MSIRWFSVPIAETPEISLEWQWIRTNYSQRKAVNPKLQYRHCIGKMFHTSCHGALLQSNFRLQFFFQNANKWAPRNVSHSANHENSLPVLPARFLWAQTSFFSLEIYSVRCNYSYLRPHIERWHQTRVTIERHQSEFSFRCSPNYTPTIVWQCVNLSGLS